MTTFGEAMEPGLEDAGLGKGAVWRCRDPGKTLFDGGSTIVAEAMLVENIKLEYY